MNWVIFWAFPSIWGGRVYPTLEVILPDPRLKLSDFSFEWTIDGKVASKEAKLNCGCGKNATLKVTQNSTKQSVIKTMALPEACQSGVNSKE